MIREFNNLLLKQASKLNYSVSAIAPNSERDLFNNPLVIWNGASDNTIWNDPKVNWAFRALHDALHKVTRLNFTVDCEIELGRIQASQYQGLLADLIYCEVAGQASYYKANGVFVSDQIGFTKERLGL